MTHTDGDSIYSHGSSVSPGSAGGARLQLRAADEPDRIAELERENGRLQRLVAELLMKNQQLRRAE